MKDVLLGRLNFPKKLKLTKNQEFRAVLANRKVVRNDDFLLYFAKNDLDFSRFGISVGKKFGNSVQRNRLKRLARETFRQLQHKFPFGYDYLLIYSAKMTNNSISSKLGLESAKNSMVSLLNYAKKRHKI